MYFHVIENTMRNSVKGYRHVKTYRTYKPLQTFLEKEGKSFWVIESAMETLPRIPYLRDPSQPIMYGGFTASYWNTGGWGTTTMPIMPLLV